MGKTKKDATLETRFEEAVEKYRDLINENYFCRMGDEEPEGPVKEEIEELFREAGDVVQKQRFLYILLERLCRSGRDERLHRSRCQKCFELHDKLKKT